MQSRAPFNTCAEVVDEDEDELGYQQAQDDEEEEDEKVIYKVHVTLQ